MKMKNFALFLLLMFTNQATSRITDKLKIHDNLKTKINNAFRLYNFYEHERCKSIFIM